MRPWVTGPRLTRRCRAGGVQGEALDRLVPGGLRRLSEGGGGGLKKPTSWLNMR